MSTINLKLFTRGLFQLLDGSRYLSCNGIFTGLVREDDYLNTQNTDLMIMYRTYDVDYEAKPEVK